MSTNPRGGVPPDKDLPRCDIILNENARSALQSACGGARSAGGCDLPRFRWFSGRVGPVELGRVGRNDSLLEHEATVEAPFAGLDHAIGFLRKFIEGKSLDRAH